MPQTLLSRQFLRIEHRGRTIAAADSLHEIAEAFRQFRPRAFFVCDVVVDTHRGGSDDARIWGRIVGHPNGMLSVEPDRSRASAREEPGSLPHGHVAHELAVSVPWAWRMREQALMKLRGTA